MGRPTLHFEHRMSEQDAVLWTIESDPLLRSTVTSVALLDRSPDRRRLTERIERASRTVPRLRQRVVTTPWNLSTPEYVVDPDFDLGYHMRWQKAPGAGTLRDVLDVAEPFAMAGFDRSRPLWGLVVLEDLEDGGAALVMKVHHSLADGVGMMRISTAFFDLEAQPPDDPTPMPAAPPPGRPSLWGRYRSGVTDRVRSGVSVLSEVPGRTVSAVRHPMGTTEGAVRSTTSTARMLRPVTRPLSPVMVGRSPAARFDSLVGSLPALKAAAKRVDGRLNDAFLAAVAGGLDRYHRSHGAPVDHLRMTMPINLRTRDDDVAGGNRFVPARFVFPVSVADPLERLVLMRDLVVAQRAEPALHLAGSISGVLNRMPGAVTTALFGRMLKAIDVVTSNVPGAPFDIFVAGARMRANYAFGPLSGAACNLTLLSYGDAIDLGISTDPAAVPDPEVFVDCIQDGFAEIEGLAAG